MTYLYGHKELKKERICLVVPEAPMYRLDFKLKGKNREKAWEPVFVSDPHDWQE